jgi:hypothetical protein
MPSAKSWPAELAELAVSGGDVEDVVAQLVDHAEGPTEGREGLHFGLGALAGEGAELTGQGRRRGRPALDRVAVVGLRCAVTEKEVRTSETWPRVRRPGRGYERGVRRSRCPSQRRCRPSGP